MEFLDLIKFIKVYFKQILAGSLVGILVGVAAYLIIPQTYNATGSFYVERSVETSNIDRFFTYEGYYSQQTAQSFTNTLLAMFESDDIKSQALEGLGQKVSEQSLRKLSKSMRIKKAAPQLITLTVKNRAAKEAEATWNALTEQTLSTANNLNRNGDSKIKILQLNVAPVVKESFRSIYLNIILGFLFGLTATSFIYAYLSTSNFKSGKKK